MTFSTDLSRSFQVDVANFYYRTGSPTFHLLLLSGNTKTDASTVLNCVADEITDAPYARTAVAWSGDATFDATDNRAEMPQVEVTIENTGGVSMTWQQAALVRNGNSRRPAAFTTTAVNISTNRITVSSHGLTEGEAIAFKGDIGAILPPPLAAATGYVALNVTTNDFQVSNDGIAALDLTGTGTGNFFLLYAAGRLERLLTYASPFTLSPAQSTTYRFNAAARDGS